MLEGKTRLVNTKTRIQNTLYDRFLLHVPLKVARDSQFPFEAGKALNIVVDPVKKIMTLSKTRQPRATRKRRRRARRTR